MAVDQILIKLQWVKILKIPKVNIFSGAMFDLLVLEYSICHKMITYSTFKYTRCEMLLRHGSIDKVNSSG